MVFEGRIAEMLQNQASRFLRGFSADQLKLGLLSGRLELVGLALNAEPLDSLLLESEVPLVMKAGVLSSATIAIALLQGELELVIDGLLLVLGPACRWLTKTEVFSHRLNEIQRLEFVHMRSQCQRRTLEREMFRQLFSDYLSRLKISVKNIHVRVEVEGEVDSSPGGRNLHAGFGIILGSCDITPVKGVVKPPDKDKDPASSELLLAESVDVKGLALYHEPPDRARVLVPWSLYYNTRNRPLGVFDDLKQENFVALLDDCRRHHAQVPVASQLMPPANFVVGIDLRSQPVRDGFHVDSCLTMEITVKLAEPSRIHFSTVVLDHLSWFVRRTLDFQLWQFLHPVRDPPERSRDRWSMIRSFVALKRRIHSNTYSLREAIMMRIHCKEYVRLYKKKFNGQSSVVQWRKSLPALTHLDAVKLSDIELVYPADKLVNFRLMAHAELKTEMALNSFLNSDDAQSTGQYRRAARELTPLEQLHLHGQHGYGVNIYRGLPPPPSSLKIRIDIQASRGLWWTCRLSDTSVQPGARGQAKTADLENCWTVALDCAAQPIRVLLVDSIVDASVFATIEVPRAPLGQRPLAVLLGRTASAFLTGSPGRAGNPNCATFGGKGPQEWCSVLELDGPVYCCSQLKTVLTSSPNSPWDVFLHFSCGDSLDMTAGVSAMDSFGSQQTQRVHSGIAGTGGDRDACIRIRVPLILASGQAGPLVNFLKQCLTSSRNSSRQEVKVGPSNSLLAWFVRRAGSANDVAVFRLHLRVPPVLIEGSFTGDHQSFWFPRFDSACHLEHGGLVDGFVVGLHHLRHFAAFVSSASSSSSVVEQGSGRGSQRSGGASWPLLPLEQSPSCALLFTALAAAFTVAMGSRSNSASAQQADAALLSLLKRSDLAGIARKNEGLSDPESPASAVTLLLIVLAVMVSRRVLWDERDSRSSGPDAEADVAVTNALNEVHWLVGSMMKALLTMGFPLHSRCLPIAAWLGAIEVLQVMSSPAQLSSLVTWTARGAYANLQSRQEEVLRWLLRQRANIDAVDKDGRTLLDWACWGGSEALAGMGVRAGLLHASLQGGRSLALTQASSTAASPQLPPPSPLTLAVAGRSPRIVSMLLRASCDPHAPARGSGCGPLLLAVRMCEYDLACQVLSGAAFISVDAALGPTINGTQNGFAKGDSSSETTPMGGCTVRATVALIDSLRRFAGSLSRRTAEDYAGSVGTSNMRAHLPGPHPDEGLYSTAQLPFSDILHPLAVQLPMPLHKVGHEFRPHPPPHRWLRRGTVNPWSRAQRFIECCVQRDFRPDSSVLSRALPHLPTEARNIVQQLFGSGQCYTEVSIDGSPNGSTPWFGAVLGNDVRDRGESQNASFFGGSPVRSDFTPERNELSAAISFAKEIRELRTRSPSEGVPPLDIAAALGADGLGGRRNSSHRLQASPGPPTMWVTVSLGGSSPSAGPVCLDALRVQSGSLTLKLRESGRTVEALGLQEIAAIRQFQLSGFEGPEMKHIVEIRLRPEADAMPLVENLLASMGEAHIVNGLRNGSTHLVNLVFLRSEDAEQFAAILQSTWQNYETRGIEDQDDSQGASPWDPTQLRACVLRGAETLKRLMGESKDAAPLPKVRVAVIGAPRVGKTRVAACIVNELAGVANEGIPQEGDSGPAWLRVSSGRWPIGNSSRAEVHVWDGSAAPLPGQLERHVVDPSVPLLLIAVLDAGLTGFGTPAEALASACMTEATSSSGSSSAPRRALVVENVFAGAALGAPALSRGEHGQHVLRCNLRDARSGTELRRAFSGLLSEIVEQIEVRHRSSRRPIVPPVPHGHGDWSSVVVARPSLPPPSVELGIDAVLSSRLRGDSVLLDPSAVSWAWSTIWASHGCLTEGLAAASCGGVVIPWERVERVLSIVDYSGEGSRSEAALVLMRALADVGLVCPIPIVSAFAESSTGSSSLWVVVPDFARRIQLVSPASLRIACGEAVKANDTQEDTPGSRETYISARLMWDAPSSAPPSLRTSLRNFLARAAAGTSEKTFEMRRFILLEVGPSGVSRPLSAADGLAPGFLLAFDLVSQASRQSEDTLGATGSYAKAPLPSVREATPSGHVTHSARSTNNGVLFAHSDDDLATGTSSGSGFSNGSRLTAILVASSHGAEGKKSSEKPFWDLRCAGPHAQWAFRMFLGSGATGPSFTGFRRNKARNATSGGSSSSSAWPFPTPACVLSQVEEGADASPDFATFAWLFHRSLAVGQMRSAAAGDDDDNPCACCAALCGKSDQGGFGGASSSSSCANLEAALLARNWWEVQRCLDEALASGWEAWSSCAASMARLAHEFAAAAGGSDARALPLLAEAGNGMGGGSRAVALVPEDALPLAVGTKLRPPGATLGQIRSCPGVEVWLRLCRPLALWSAAGASRGFAVASRELLTAAGSGGGRIGEQVSDALKIAMSVNITAEMIAEVWDALKQLEASRHLFRRSVGTWVQIEDGSGFLL